MSDPPPSGPHADADERPSTRQLSLVATPTTPVLNRSAYDRFWSGLTIMHNIISPGSRVPSTIFGSEGASSIVPRGRDAPESEPSSSGPASGTLPTLNSANNAGLPTEVSVLSDVDDDPEFSVHNSHPASVSVTSNYSAKSQVVIDGLAAANAAKDEEIAKKDEELARLRKELLSKSEEDSVPSLARSMPRVIEEESLDTDPSSITDEVKGTEAPPAVSTPKVSAPAKVVGATSPKEPEGSVGGAVVSKASGVGTYDRNDSFIADSGTPSVHSSMPTARDPLPFVSETPGVGWTGRGGCRDPSCGDSSCTKSKGGSAGVSNNVSFHPTRQRGGTKADEADEESFMDESQMSGMSMVTSKHHSFFTEETAALNASLMQQRLERLGNQAQFEAGRPEVTIPSNMRIKSGEPGYREQREEMYRTGAYKLKQSQKLGAWNRESTNPDKAVKSENILGKFQEIESFVTDFRQFAEGLDLGSLFWIPKARKKFADNSIPSEELQLIHPFKLFEQDEEGNLDSLNIFADFYLLTQKQVKLWQRVYSAGNCGLGEADEDSNRILYHAIRNSLTDDLQKSVDRLYKRMFDASRHETGGISYLYTVLCKVLIGSNSNAKALIKEFNRFAKVGPSFIKGGDNISLLADYLSYVILNPLIAMDAFKSSADMDPVAMVYAGLAKSECPVFQRKYEKLGDDHLDEQTSAKSALDFTFNATQVSRVVGTKAIEVLDDAAEKYLVLVRTGDYVCKDGKELTFNAAIDTDRFLAAGCKCHNCGGPHHMNDCPKELDPDAIARNKAADKPRRDKRAKDRKEKKNGAGDDDGSIVARDDKGNTGDDKKKKQRSWKIATSKPQKVEFKCMDCGGKDGKWTNHTTELHAKAIDFGPSFNMSKIRSQKNHPGVKKMKELGGADAGSETPTNAGEPKGEKDKAVKEYTEKLQALHDRKSTLAAGSSLYTAIEADIQALTATFTKDFA